MNKKISFALVIVIFLVGFFLVNEYKNNPSLALPLSGEGRGEVSPPDKGDLGGYQNIKSVRIAGQEIKVDLAVTSIEQTQGLSGRKNLGLNKGMLFVFSNSGKNLFWMKDMNFPIDIIWFTEDMKVDYIKKDADPKLFPETYGPGQGDKDAKYVLEVNAGFSDKNNLKVGDSVLFTY